MINSILNPENPVNPVQELCGLLSMALEPGAISEAEFAAALDEVASAAAPGYSVHRSSCPYEHGGACTCS